MLVVSYGLGVSWSAGTSKTGAKRLTLTETQPWEDDLSIIRDIAELMFRYEIM